MMSSDYRLADYKVVTPVMNSMFSAAEVRIASTSVRFNNLTAAELGYPAYVRLMVNQNCDSLVIQAVTKDEDGALPFMKGRTPEDLVGQKKWISVCNKMLAIIIRTKMGWEDKTLKRVIGVPWRNQNAIIFNLHNVMAPKCRTPVLTPDEVLMTYKSAEEGAYLPMVISPPANSRGRYGIVPPEFIEAEFSHVV